MTFFVRSSALAAAALAFVLCTAAALAGPGAHGPDGQHLDNAAGSTVGAASHPRIEARSELFELVGYLLDGELSIMINRFETNEPVLGANVEVSKGSSKAVAKFHADHGDYAVDDAAFLEALRQPGEHALMFTVIGRGESDLLEGTLMVAAARSHGNADGHSHALEYALIAGAIAVLLGGVVLWRRRARTRVHSAQTGAHS